MRTTHADWVYLATSIIGAFVVFYLSVWFWESGRAGSWRVAHARMWKKPKKWQLITLCVLWAFIIIALIVAFSIRRPN
jgi:accessory gene regulator protein AgrB